MRTLLTYTLPLAAAALMPSVVYAQGVCTGARTVGQLLCTIADVAGTAIPVAFIFALIYFFWGIAKFIFSAGDTTKVEEGKAVMLWGVVVLFVIASVWGIIGVLRTTFFG